jgi:methyltransferase (TIGR00027 family)
MAEGVISNVSDTARWIAWYRAQESARPDAHFRDPLAATLGGERGRAIAAVTERMPNAWAMPAAMVARTKLIDDLVLTSIAEGCDCVLNLAAGLDTRPYRLVLPPTLPWIEADLPAMVAEKTALLAAETPVCRLSRDPVDLADPVARGALFDRVAAQGSRVLVISEGLVGYLDEDVVVALARDLAARPTFRWWMLDLSSRAIRDMMMKGMRGELDSAPLTFAPDNGVAFFEALGWKALEIRSLFHEAVRLKRVPWFFRLFAWFPQPDPRNPGGERWSAVVRLHHD